MSLVLVFLDGHGGQSRLAIFDCWYLGLGELLFRLRRRRRSVFFGRQRRKRTGRGRRTGANVGRVVEAKGAREDGGR